MLISLQVEITGIRDERLEQRKPSLLDPEYQNKEGVKGDQVPYPILSLLQEQFTTLLPSAVVLYQHYNKCSPQTLAPKPVFHNFLEIQGKEVCNLGKDSVYILLGCTDRAVTKYFLIP